jgi:hypothetical protein
MGWVPDLYTTIHRPSTELYTGDSTVTDLLEPPKTNVIRCPRCRRSMLSEWGVKDFETCPVCQWAFLIRTEDIVRSLPTTVEGGRK